MSGVFLGKDVLDNREQFDSLPAEFFSLIDPEGTNVIAGEIENEEGYYVHCLMKFVGRTLPFEAYIIIPRELYTKIVFEIDINSLGEIH